MSDLSSTLANVNTNTNNDDHKDPETDDEHNAPNSDGSDIMSNEEFARRSQAFRRSTTYARPRTNIRLTLNTAQLIRADLLNLQRQLESMNRSQNRIPHNTSTNPAVINPTSTNTNTNSNNTTESNNTNTNTNTNTTNTQS